MPSITHQQLEDYIDLLRADRDRLQQRIDDLQDMVHGYVQSAIRESEQETSQ